MALSRITEAVASFTDLTIGDDLTLTDDLLLASDANIIKFGADAEVTLTHVHNTGLLLNSTSVIQFNDAAESIHSDGSKLILTSNSVAFSLPTADGSSGQTLQTNGSGVLSFATASANTPSSADGQALGTASLEWSDLFLADGGTIQFGNDQDIILTHVADTGLLLNGTSQLQFNDASQNIGAPNATTLDINADAEIELNATLIDVNGNLDVSGTIVSGGTLTATTSIGIGSAVLTEAELELLDGITAGTAAASKVLVLDSNKDIGTIRNLTIDGVFTDGNYTFDTSGNVSGLGTIGSGNITSSGTIQGTTITATTAFVPDASDGAALGTTALEFSDLFLADGAVISLGDDDDVTLTHVADTGILLNGTSQLQFNDASQNITAPSATVLDINATDEVELNATLVDINANVEISGTAAITGIATFTDDIIIGDGKTIGVASDVDVITIASTGVTTFSKGVVGKTLTDTSNTGDVALDFSLHTNFVLTLTGNITSLTASNEVAGQSGFIVFIQDGTGSRTVSLHGDYETAGSGGITLSTAANARDIIPYAVSASGSVILGAVQKAFG